LRKVFAFFGRGERRACREIGNCFGIQVATNQVFREDNCAARAFYCQFADVSRDILRTDVFKFLRKENRFAGKEVIGSFATNFIRQITGR